MGYYKQMLSGEYDEEIAGKLYSFGQYDDFIRMHDYVADEEFTRNYTEDEIDEIFERYYLEGYYLPPEERRRFICSTGTEVRIRVIRDVKPEKGVLKEAPEFAFDKEVCLWVRDNLNIKSDELLLKLLSPYSHEDDMRKLKAFLCAVDSKLKPAETFSAGMSESARRNAAVRIFGGHITNEKLNSETYKGLINTELFKAEPAKIYDKTTDYLERTPITKGDTTFSIVNPEKISERIETFGGQGK